MEDARLLFISLMVSIIGLILLLSISATQRPAAISSISPEDIGSKAYVEGVVTRVYRSSDGHLFFTLRDKTGSIPVVAFKEVAERLSCVEKGRSIGLRGIVDEYHGELELILRRESEVNCTRAA